VPVSQAMVKAYYDKHPDRFGGKTVRSYEIVKGLVKLKSANQNKLIEQLGEFDSKTDWQQKVVSLKQGGLQIQYARGAADGKLLDAKFQQAVGALDVDEVSPVYFFEGYPSIIRVTKVHVIGAKPLSEVSSDIRKTLLPIQLKQAIKQAAAGLSQSMTVEYQNGA
jgi:ribosomal protein S16